MNILGVVEISLRNRVCLFAYSGGRWHIEIDFFVEAVDCERIGSLHQRMPNLLRNAIEFRKKYHPHVIFKKFLLF